MIFLAEYNEQQSIVNWCVREILSEFKDTGSWSNVAKYMEDLSEASPESVLSRLQKGLHDDTGMLELFEEKSSFFFGESPNYTHILWAVEMLLEQNNYAARAVRLLMELSNKVEKCSSGNNPRDNISNVFCTWYNATVLSAEDKLLLAKEGLDRYSFLWDILYEIIHRRPGGIIFPNQKFSYRKRVDLDREPDWSEMAQQEDAYYNLLLSHTYSADKWVKMVKLFPSVSRTAKVGRMPA